MTTSDALEFGRNQFKKAKENLADWLKQDVLQNSSKTTIRLGIWGTTGAGKTTYLTMLYDALEMSNQWVVTVDEKARTFVEDNLTRIKEQRQFPAPTEPSEKLEVFRYTLTSVSRYIRKKIVLDFIDAPGEFYEDIRESKTEIEISEAPTNQQREQSYPPEVQSMDIVDYLNSCDGIIFLLDPIRSKGNGKAYSTLLRNLFLEFQERSRHPEMKTEQLEQYMAFCINKFDRENLWENSKKAYELAQEIMGMELQRIGNFCWVESNEEIRRFRLKKKNRCEFFTISSIGRYQDEHGKYQEAVIYPNKKTNPASGTQVNEPPIVSPKTNDDEIIYVRQKKGRGAETIKTTTDHLQGTTSHEYETDNQPEQLPRRVETIKPDVPLLSHKVLDPIEWLIPRIQKYPPLHPCINNLADSNSQTDDD